MKAPSSSIYDSSSFSAMTHLKTPSVLILKA